MNTEQNYDRGQLPFIVRKEDGKAVSNPINDNGVADKYRNKLPKCDTPHPKYGHSCVICYPNNLELWCESCLLARSIEETLGRYESFKKKVLVYLSHPSLDGHADRRRMRKELEYLAKDEL